MRAITSRPGQRQTGFTLLELMVAITLMGLVLVVLYSGLRLGLNGWDSGEARAEATNRQRLVEEFLRRQLAQSLTVFQINDRQEAMVVFSGQADRIEFVAPMSAQWGQSGLYRMRLEVREGQLWIHWRPYRPGDPDSGEEQARVLLEEVSAAEWAYFGPERDEDPQPRWQSVWTPMKRRPLLARLNLTVQRQPWPDLVVALPPGAPQ